MEIEKLLAKSLDKGGMKLVEHLELCADNCYENAIVVGCNEYNSQLCYLSGLLHDVGKCINNFQDFLNGKDTNSKIRHNEVSAYIISNFIRIEEIGSERNEIKDTLIRSVLYHHPVYSMTHFDMGFEYDIDDLKLNNDEISRIKDLLNICILRYKVKFGDNCKYNIEYYENKNAINSNKYLTNYRRSIAVKSIESPYLTILNILKVSDIMASYSDSKSYHYMFYNHMPSDYIFKKPEKYDDRFYEQKEISKKLFSRDFSILEAPTGFGKTLMGVMYLLSNNRKGYWVCPRNTIAESIYKTIVEEINSLGLSKEISVALLLTNKYKFGDCNSDIIVTNIDNYVRPLLRTDANDRAINMVFNNTIFDEFHEYVYDKSLLGMFCTVIAMRSQLKGVKTLLMSATLPYFDGKNLKAVPYEYCKLDDYCFISRNDIKNKSITDKKYRIVFGEKVDSNVKGKNTLVNVNSVSSCQLAYKSKCTDHIIHSRFEGTDLNNIKDALYETHNKKYLSDIQNVQKNTSFVSTNMISTGVDVSFSNLVCNFAQPDKLIQLVGRINRYSECVDIPTIYLPDFKKFNYKSEECAVNTNYNSKLSIMFYDFLRKKIANNSIISLEKLYELREQFLKEKEKEIYAFQCEVMKESFNHLSDLNYTKKNVYDEDGKQYISNKISLRNNGEYDSFFAIFKIDNAKDCEMTGPICVDNGLIKDDIIEDSILKNAIKYIKRDKDLISKYVGNRYVFKKGEYSKVKRKLMAKALCDETPLPILSDYAYSKKIGIYLKKIFE